MTKYSESFLYRHDQTLFSLSTLKSLRLDKRGMHETRCYGKFSHGVEVKKREGENRTFVSCGCVSLV